MALFDDPSGKAPKYKPGKGALLPGLELLRRGARPAPTPTPRTVYTAPKAQGNLNTSWASAPAAAPAPQQQTYQQGYDAAASQAAAAQAAATAKANSEGKAASKKQNDSTRSQAESQRKLIDSFGSQRDTKLTNIQEALNRSSSLLLNNYQSTYGALQENLSSNDASEADASFKNVTNAIRERGELLNQTASQGAGETDMIKSQLQALRNYSSNQSDVSRSFFDTLNSINSSITGLNADTATSRTNLFNQSQTDMESTWANYYNQAAETWTQIQNIENSNTNTDTDSSEAYAKIYSDAADKAAEAARGSYKRVGAPADWNNWAGKGKTADRALAGNKAATVNLGGPLKRPEGATLRKW